LLNRPRAGEGDAKTAEVNLDYRQQLESELQAKLGGRFAGSMTEVATFSFYPTKNLGAIGDGGMVVARDPERIRRVRMLREYGWERRYISDLPGVNSRLDELQAAILRMRLPYLDAANRRRAEIAAAYNDGLAGTELVLPMSQVDATQVYHQYVVRHPGRDQFQTRLKQAGIGTNIHYPVPVHRQPAYAGCELRAVGKLSHTDFVMDRIFWVGVYPGLTRPMLDHIVATIRKFVKR